jgi:hypothetical protein
MLYLCHCLYRTSVPLMPVHYSIPNTACIPLLLRSCHFLHHSSVPSTLPVQCAIPAAACITALLLHPCQLSVLFLPLPVSQFCPFTIASSVCYSCHCLYHSSAPSPLPAQCAIPTTACITVLHHHPCQFSVLLFLPLLYTRYAPSPLPVQCAIPATACITPFPLPSSSLPIQCAMPATVCITALPLHPCQFSVLFLPLPVSQFCIIIPASSVCCYSCHFCITGMPLRHCQFSVLFLLLPVSHLFLFLLHPCQFSVLCLPLSVSQLCLFTPASSVCYSCHCLYHSSAPSPLPVQCAIPGTACITALPLHYCQFSELLLPLPVSHLCPFIPASPVCCHCQYHSSATSPLPLPLHHCQSSVLFLPLSVSQLCPFTPASSVGYSCHCLYHSSASSSLPVQCAIPTTACITALPLHPCQFSVLFLPLSVSQLCLFTPASSVCYSCHCLYHSSAPSPLPVQWPIPATACITALPLHPCQFGGLFLPQPVSQLCPFTLASSVCYSCPCLHHSSAPSTFPVQCAIPGTSCITALPLQHCKLSVLFLPLPVSQLSLFIPGSSVCYSCHCLYHSSAILHRPVQCAIPDTACITALPLHPGQFSELFLALPISQLCPFTTASLVSYSWHCLYHSSASSLLPV